MKRPERVAAVDKIEGKRKPEDFIGHRNRTRQVLSAYMSLTSVFGMAAQTLRCRWQIKQGLSVGSGR